MHSVLDFLRKHNLKDTEALFRKECQNQGVPENGVQSKSDIDISEEFLEPPPILDNGDEPSAFVDKYEQLVRFTENALDAHKPELSSLLYPVFVHMYLRCIGGNRCEEAQILANRWVAIQSDLYSDDLEQLLAIKKPEHLRGNSILNNFGSGSFTLTMSRETNVNMKQFLKEKRMPTVTSIVDSLCIEVIDGPPRSRALLDCRKGATFGEAKREFNKPKVLYGLLKEPDMPTGEESADGEEPKRKKSKREPTKKTKLDPNAPTKDRIPLPELKDADKVERKARMQELSKRVKLGPNQMPTACCYTLHNLAGETVPAAAFTEDGSLLAAALPDSSIRVWSLTREHLQEMRTADELERLDKEDDGVLMRMMVDRGVDTRLLVGHSGLVLDLCFTADRKLLLSASEDGTARLWSTQMWACLCVYRAGPIPMLSAHIAPLGHYFVTGGHDNVARIWSTDSPSALRILTGHLSDVTAVQFHPNCNYVATGCADRAVRLFDVLNGKQVRLMAGHRGTPLALAFSTCGRYLASGCSQGGLCLWDVSSGHLIAVLGGHSGCIYCLTFDRDGALLNSSGQDFTLRSWDVAKIIEHYETSSASAGSAYHATLVDQGKSMQLACYHTKKTSLLALQYTRRNILLTAGKFD